MERTPLVELPDELIRPGSSRTPARYLLGIDGGATKTLAAVLDLERCEVHVGHGGPSNEDAVGTDSAVRALKAAADQALEGAGIGPEELGAAVVGVAGTNSAKVVRDVRAGLHEAWIVVNDVVGAWATATGAGPGVGVISGTGSNVFGVAAGGRAWRAGGWGQLVGDEGSGYWIGAESIKAALHDRDASGPPTRLSDAIPAFYEQESIEAVANLVYSRPLGKGEIAALAQRTAELALQGDEVSLAIYDLAARELARQIRAVVKMTGLTGAFPVGLIGSVFRAGELFVAPLTGLIRERSPEARVQVVHMPPVGGALLLAARASGQTDSVAAIDLASLVEPLVDARPDAPAAAGPA
jgi:glucosamine kinase